MILGWCYCCLSDESGKSRCRRSGMSLWPRVHQVKTLSLKIKRDWLRWFPKFHERGIYIWNLLFIDEMCSWLFLLRIKRGHVLMKRNRYAVGQCEHVLILKWWIQYTVFATCHFFRKLWTIFHRKCVTLYWNVLILSWFSTIFAISNQSIINKIRNYHIELS